MFSREITVQEEGEYIFSARSDDGSRILIDNSIVVDNDGLHGAVTVTNSVLLVSGTYNLRVEFFEKFGGKVLEVAYKTDNPNFEPISTDGVLAYTASNL